MVPELEPLIHPADGGDEGGENEGQLEQEDGEPAMAGALLL